MTSEDEPPVVFQAKVNDWRAFKALRLEALSLEPSAFGTTHAEAITRPDAFWLQRLSSDRNIDLVARAENRLVGMVGAWIPSEPADAGIAIVIGMYVAKEFRGTGLARRLLHALIDHLAARPDVQTLRLWVSQDRTPAWRLYESFGFRITSEASPESHTDETGAQFVMERSFR